MLKTKLILILFLAVGAFSSCKKEDYDPEKQLQVDDALIKEFIAKNNIPAIKHDSGIYYQIIAPGTGNVIYSASTQISASYEGRLLNGSVFQKASYDFPLGGVIPGWQIGIPMIQKGGKIRLIIPSVLAYGNEANGSIPKNSILDFTVELTNVQ